MASFDLDFIRSNEQTLVDTLGLDGVNFLEQNDIGLSGFAGVNAGCLWFEYDEMLSSDCSLCGDKIEHPSVELYCNCKYHLKCFNTFSKTNKCKKCDDFIIKEKDEHYKSCSICLEPMKKDISKLPCNHKFHKNCINQWTFSVNQNNSNLCPMCRKPY